MIVVANSRNDSFNLYERFSESVFKVRGGNNCCPGSNYRLRRLVIVGCLLFCLTPDFHTVAFLQLTLIVQVSFVLLVSSAESHHAFV